MSVNFCCAHRSVVCINQYELIRKYRCNDCDGVMMCTCDETFGKRFLSHQLSNGTELRTQERVPVTLGFQPLICNECRGGRPENAPVAAIFGRTTKIKRYYWRELAFSMMQRAGDWESSHMNASVEEREAAMKQIELDVLEEIKTRHASSPKFDMSEPSQAEILAQCDVMVEAFHPDYAKTPTKGLVVVMDNATVSPEVYAARQFEALGWSTLPLESVPFHALFGIMMWHLIQHPSDEKSEIVGFGSRDMFEVGEPASPIWTHLPTDFGSGGFSVRRREQIEEHFAFIEDYGGSERLVLLELFDTWQNPSEGLRQYLWAHRQVDVDRARRLIEILPPDTIVSILRYLVDDYWSHYLGWPDLLLFRDNDFMLVEVKSPSDKLSKDQLRWISDNHERLRLPFRLAKLHRPSKQSLSAR